MTDYEQQIFSKKEYSKATFAGQRLEECDLSRADFRDAGNYSLDSVNTGLNLC